MLSTLSCASARPGSARGHEAGGAASLTRPGTGIWNICMRIGFHARYPNCLLCVFLIFVRFEGVQAERESIQAIMEQQRAQIEELTRQNAVILQVRASLNTMCHIHPMALAILLFHQRPLPFSYSGTS